MKGNPIGFMNVMLSVNILFCLAGMISSRECRPAIGPVYGFRRIIL